MFKIIDEGYLLAKLEMKKLTNISKERFLCCYQILLDEEIVSEFSVTDLYISRYYWLKKYYNFYKKSFGDDAGMEQQIGKLIEEMCNKFEPQFDWNIIEKVSKMAESD